MARYFPNAKISAIHGQPKVIRGRLIVPMYHPAAALHQGSLRPVIQEDFARLPELITRAEKLESHAGGSSHQEDEEPTQLSLF